LSVSDALRALANEVEPRRLLRFGWGSRAFQGTVGDTGFDIQRIIRYRNSFLPRIRGEIRADTRGCSISVSMSLSAPTLLFIVAWLAVAVTGAFSALGGPGRSPAEYGPVPVSAALVAFVWLMTSGGFGFEAAKAERLLTKIFKAGR
jgi:hypothetical protein